MCPTSGPVFLAAFRVSLATASEHTKAITECLSTGASKCGSIRRSKVDHALARNSTVSEVADNPKRKRTKQEKNSTHDRTKLLLFVGLDVKEQRCQEADEETKGDETNDDVEASKTRPTNQR